MHLTKEEWDKINEIEKQLAKTTEGKWITFGLPYDECDDPGVSTEDGVYICQTIYDTLSGTEEHNIEADTRFIANAKDNIDYLLKLIYRITNKNCS
jgi:hypothetical protein